MLLKRSADVIGHGNSMLEYVVRPPVGFNGAVSLCRDVPLRDDHLSDERPSVVSLHVSAVMRVAKSLGLMRPFAALYRALPSFGMTPDGGIQRKTPVESSPMALADSLSISAAFAALDRAFWNIRIRISRLLVSNHAPIIPLMAHGG